MGLLLDSFWRAVANCLHPRVIALSLLPLLAVALAVGALGYFFWEGAVEGVRAWLESSALISGVGNWLAGLGMGGFKLVMAPLIVVALTTPVIVLATLLCVLLMMTPALVDFVARRRFPTLERRHGGSFLMGLFWALGSSLAALAAMVISLPLWLVPPLILVLPPLIWGWLAYRLLAYDSLAAHASADERRTLLREHRLRLLGMGVLAGYLGAAPSVIWAFGAAILVTLFLPLVVVAIWIYTLVFVFCSLWFAHYTLAALDELRRRPAAGGSFTGTTLDVPGVVPAAAGAAGDEPLALPHDRKPDPSGP